MKETFDIFYELKDEFFVRIYQVLSSGNLSEIKELEELQGFGILLYMRIKTDEEKQKILGDETNYEDDWGDDIKPVLRKDLLGKEIEKYLSMVIRQAAFIDYMLNTRIQIIESNERGGGRNIKFMKAYGQVVKSLQWGGAHLSSLIFLLKLRSEKYSGAAVKGGKVKAQKTDERKSILRCLVRNQIEKNKPNRGWGNISDTAKYICNRIIPIIDSNNFPVDVKEENKDDLIDDIQNLIAQSGELSKIYEGLRN